MRFPHEKRPASISLENTIGQVALVVTPLSADISSTKPLGYPCNAAFFATPVHVLIFSLVKRLENRIKPIVPSMKNMRKKIRM
jgi:hypothetical protein